MDDAGPLDVDVRLLTSFVVVAETLHVTRAAERLHVAQPALSQQISRLERQVGAALFDRGPRGLTLTPAGRALLDGAAPALRDLGSAVEAARAVATGAGGTLTVAYLSSFAVRAVPVLAAAFRDARPDVGLGLREATREAQLEALREGTIDVALFHRPEGAADDAPDLTVEVLAAGPRYLVVPADDRRAGLPSTTLGSAAEDVWIVPSGDEVSGYRAGLVATLRREGFEPRIGPQANAVNTILGLVAGGFGVALVAWPTALLPREGVAFVPVAGLRSQAVAARSTRSGPAAAAFVAAARTAMEELAPAG